MSTKSYCDRCGKEIAAENSSAISIARPESLKPTSVDVEYDDFDLCIDCLEVVRSVVQPEKKQD